MKFILETERLRFREFSEDDAEALLIMEKDPDVLRYVGRRPLADVEAYRAKIRTVYLPLNGQEGPFGVWAIIEKATEEFIGGCSMTREAEIGFGLRKPSWGKGYGTEVARALVGRAFGATEVMQVVATVEVENEASRRVLEKVGLRPLGEPVQLDGEEDWIVKYGLTREQYQG